MVGPEGGGQNLPESQQSFQPTWVMKKSDEFAGMNPFVERVAGQLHRTPESMLTPDYLQRRFENIQERVFSGEVSEQEAETLLSRIGLKREEVSRRGEEGEVQRAKESREMVREVISDLVVSLGTQQKETRDVLERLGRVLGTLTESAEREPMTDQEIVDSIRQILVRSETRGEILDWLEPRGREMNSLLFKIKETGLREKVYDEIEVRRRWLALAKQWDRVNGSEENIGKLLFDMGRINMEPKMLVELSTLPETKEGVSLSVQISRAMNLYYNFLGAWAEGLDPNEAQLRLAKISNEEKIPGLEENGIKAGFFKKMLVTLPDELKAYRAVVEINSKGDNELLSLEKIFGSCMFIQKVSDLDVAWTKFVVAGLSGSTDAANLALEMLDFTGETDELNVVWQEGAYASTDYQKLLRMEKRRATERNSEPPNPFGPEATLGRYPQKSGKGWLRRAKIEKMTINECFRGEWNVQKKEWTREPIPFHKMNWKNLSEKTYTLDFVYPNMRSWVVFSKCTTEDFGKDNGMEALEAENLRSINKAFKLAFGKKEDLKREYGEEKDAYGVPKWVRHSPWVWYIIGDVSLHNPFGQIQLPGMSRPPELSDLWRYTLNTREVTEGHFTKTYKEFVQPEILRSKFLTPEEFDFIERYCQKKIK